MSWKPARSLTTVSRLWRTLAFRLTAGYALAGLILVIVATASLYLVLLSELEKSTELFLGDKLNVLRTMLRERPDDWDGLREEVDLETAARRKNLPGRFQSRRTKPPRSPIRSYIFPSARRSDFIPHEGQ